MEGSRDVLLDKTLEDWHAWIIGMRQGHLRAQLAKFRKHGGQDCLYPAAYGAGEGSGQLHWEVSASNF